MKPIRVQRSRAKGWKTPPNTVYVGRPSKWGNPFVLGAWLMWAGVALGFRGDKAGQRRAAVAFFRAWLTRTNIKPEIVRGNFGSIGYADGTEISTAEHVEGFAATMALTMAEKAPDITKPPSIEDIKNELRGKNLMCWCPLDAACHADVLLEIANS